MKICILGATGNCGTRLVRRSLDEGHETTAVARNPDGLPERYPGATVRKVDFAHHGQLVEAMAGHDVVINAAGYVAHGVAFSELVARIIVAAEEALGPDGRFWMFAGAALLDVPGTSRMTMSLPRVPPVYGPHLANFEAARASRLNWSVLCPGPMIDAPDGEAHDGLVLSAEQWPVPRPAWTKVLPWIATSLAFRNAIGRMTIYYEDAARVILGNLGPGCFSRQRVGVALPVGIRLSKPEYSTRPEPK